MPDNRTVLRTAYVPEKLDDLIRVIAFWESKLKSAVILELVQEGLQARGIKTVDEYIRNRRGNIVDK